MQNADGMQREATDPRDPERGGVILTPQHPWEDVTLFTGKDTGTEECILLSDSHLSLSAPSPPTLGSRNPKNGVPTPTTNPAVPKRSVCFLT